MAIAKRYSTKKAKTVQKRKLYDKIAARVMQQITISKKEFTQIMKVDQELFQVDGAHLTARHYEFL